MRILADIHIAPRTVSFLRDLGHDVIQVVDRLDPTASDHQVVKLAAAERRVVLTQDLDFSSIVALSGFAHPSIITLRLGSADVPTVNEALAAFLPDIEADLNSGAIVTIEERRARVRHLPLQ